VRYAGRAVKLKADPVIPGTAAQADIAASGSVISMFLIVFMLIAAS
jgi:hypothetical protein